MIIFCWKDADINTSNKEIEKSIKGIPKKITKFESGALLNEVNNKELVNKICQIKI